MTKRAYLLTVVVMSMAAALGPQRAAQAAGASPADLAALQNFKLTPEFFSKYEAYENEAASKPCELSPMFAMAGAHSGQQSLDQTAAAFDARPGVHAALQRHGLTARDMMLGMATLMSAAMQDVASQHPGVAIRNPSGFKVSAANMAVYRAHKDEFHQHQQQLAHTQLKANGGKLPTCMKGL